jgi:hypothetical protein
MDPDKGEATGKYLFRSVGVVVLAIALSGCWLQLGAGPANTRFNDVEDRLTQDNVDGLAVDWRNPVDAFVTEPVVSDGRVHTADRMYRDGEGDILDVLAVRTYDSKTGALLWETSLLPPDGSDVTGMIETPALADGALWVPYWHTGFGGCDSGRLARLDPKTGAILSTDATGPQATAVVVSGTNVASMENNCGGRRVVVRDLKTRAIRWTRTFPSGGVNTPTIANGRLFVVTGGGIHAFALDGCGASTCNPLWSESVVASSAGFLRLVAGSDTITAIDQTAEGTNPTVVVRDGATGKVRWSVDSPYGGGLLPGSITGIAVAYDTLYVAASTLDPDTSVREAVLDAYPLAGCGQPTCTRSWRAGLGTSRPAREPSVAGGVVYVPMVPDDATPPSVVGVDAQGCGAERCEPLVQVPFVDATGPFAEPAQPYATAVADGRVIVAWLPDVYGSTPSQLISLALPER